jgi:hypothetical protein
MLEKCLVGNLIGLPPVNVDTKSEKSPSTPKKEKSSAKITVDEKKSTDESYNIDNSIVTVVDVDGLNYKLIKNNTVKKKSLEIPVFDSYQSIDCVNIVIYTKCKNLLSDCVVIDKDLNQTNNMTIYVYTLNGIYKFTLGKIYFFV